MTPTPARSVRIPPKLWAAAQKKAAADETTVSAIINQYLRAYVKGKP